MAIGGRSMSILKPLLCPARSSLARQLLLPASIRTLQTSSGRGLRKIPDFAFAFDIDGVLLRSSDPIPGASAALKLLQRNRIPFILLTNGGGKTEADRVAELSEKLDVELDTGMFVQSHTPFRHLDQYKNQTVLVVGGDGDKCRQVAQSYGFKTVVTPADIMCAHPAIWPFSEQHLDFYKPFSRPLPKRIHPHFDPKTKKYNTLTIGAIFVYNDPRDWGLDSTIILDLLLSEGGQLGTLSSKNGRPELPNRGYQQDRQPPLYFSNPDLWWAAKYHHPRLGQGGFREALEGLWTAVTGGKEAGVALHKEVIGKPYFHTYNFAEKMLALHRKKIFKQSGMKGDPYTLRRVYMVGDNPESDIKGANHYSSPVGTDWWSILVKTGVHQGGKPAYRPKTEVKNVLEAVRWVLKDEEMWLMRMPKDLD